MIAPKPIRCLGPTGFEYQYWKNKFGNDHNGPAGSGAFARTPMIRSGSREPRRRK
jgi:hypothetical protein